MLNTECVKKLQSFAKKEHKQCKVAVLPDFFLDRIINLQWNILEFSDLIQQVAKRKGGSLDGIPQTDIRGGNAINVASALANLGAEVTPIICTSQHGLQLIKYYFRDLKIDSSHVKIKDKESITTALEFQKDSVEKVNVMIRDLGSLADFEAGDLDENDYKIIESSDYTCVFNWAGTLNNGTKLAQTVFARAKRGSAKTYYDTADPNPNPGGISDLIEKVLKSGMIDIFSVNENEAVSYASRLDPTLQGKRKHLEFGELAMEAARVLAKNLHSRIDLHTTAFSASIKDHTETVVPAFKVKVLRATGAGDAWTAGNIIGDKNGLSDECRLLLANSVAACYLLDSEGKHPTWETLSAFLNQNT